MGVNYSVRIPRRLTDFTPLAPGWRFGWGAKDTEVVWDGLPVLVPATGGC